MSAFLGRNPGLLTVVRAHECVFDGFQEHWPATNPDGTYNDDNRYLVLLFALKLFALN